MTAIFNLEVAHAIFDIIGLVSFCVLAATRYNNGVGATRSPVCDA